MQKVTVERIMRFLRTPEGPHNDILKKEFQYIHRTQVREPGRAPRYVGNPVDLYALQDGWMYFPCGLLERCLNVLAREGYKPEFKDLRPGKLPTPNTSKLAGLRPGQLTVIDEIIKADMGIVDALTGFGKGVVIEKIVELYPKQNHAVITKSKAVCNQLHQKLKAKFPKIGVWNSDYHIKGNPMVCTSGSLGGLELEKFDVVQLDEVHELLIPSFLEYYPAFSGCKMISYSASPDQRLDNTALAMEAYFGNKICKVDYQDGVDLGLVVPIEVWKVDWGCTPVDAIRNFQSDVKRMRLGYWSNFARNTAISRVVYEIVPQRLTEKDPQILVLVDKIEHALELKKLMPDFEVVYGNMDDESAECFKKAKLLKGDPLTKKQVEGIRKKFSAGELKRAIATGIWGTGVDFPQLSMIIRADGGASPIKDIQMPGRVCRISSGKDKGILVDFADTFDLWTARRSKNRFQSYEDKKWEVIKVNLDT
jgi:superfamily II DNA or RNA helicase